jgi:hypothetical protein
MCKTVKCERLRCVRGGNRAGACEQGSELRVPPSRQLTLGLASADTAPGSNVQAKVAREPRCVPRGRLQANDTAGGQLGTIQVEGNAQGGGLQVGNNEPQRLFICLV